MCGINGFNFQDEDLIKKMNSKTRHRGPDDQGIFVNGNISFGHNRLAIIDLSTAGHQPMKSKDGNFVIIFNGEIYNYRELRVELEKKGRTFNSKSDTEVILESYQEYGIDCLNKFNGIFAFAIWDRKKEELLLARDHIGVKPLFYYFNEKRFIFSSEIKGILEHNIKRTLNINALNFYFRFLYISGPETIFENIYKLQPASYLIFKNNKIQINKYWEIKDYNNYSGRSEIKDKIKQTLKEAVKRQLVSDVPVGVFLSGGIDSTIILGLMAELADSPIKTFSVGFDVKREQEKYNNDYLLARKTAGIYHTEHYDLIVKPQDVIDNLEKVVWHMDDLVSNPTQVPTFLLSKLAKERVKVVLGGDGGDELFGGYGRYYYYYLLEKWQKLPKILRKNNLNKKVFSLLRKNNIYEKINLENDPEIFWSFMAQKENILNKFLKPRISSLNTCERYIEKNYFVDNKDKYDLAKRMMKIDLDTWLVDESLTRSDKMSMAWGLEQRVPILDKEVVSMAMKIPTRYKISKSTQGKLIYREAMKNYIPDFVYNKAKTGWFTPMAKWLRDDLKDMAYEILSEEYYPENKAILDFKEIKKILDSHTSGSYALNTIWAIINFQVWSKKFKVNVYD